MFNNNVYKFICLFYFNRRSIPQCIEYLVQIIFQIQLTATS